MHPTAPRLAARPVDDRWIIVDVFDGVGRVVGRDGRARDRVSLERTLRQRLPVHAAAAVRSVIAEMIAADQPRCVDREVGRNTRLMARPVAGVDATLVGLQIWVGTNPGPPPGPTPVAFGAGLDLDTHTIVLPNPLPRSAPAPTRRDQRRVSSAEFLAAFDVDDSLGLLRFVLTPPGAGMVHSLLARPRRQPVGGSLHALLRRPPAGTRMWPILVHQVTDTLTHRPSLEAAALSAVAALTGADTHLAVVDLQRLNVIQWLTAPLPHTERSLGVDWHVTVHPDDYRRLVSAAARLRRASTTDPLTVATVNRVRVGRRCGGWTVLDTTTTALPDTAAALGVARATVTGVCADHPPVTAGRGCR